MSKFKDKGKFLGLKFQENNLGYSLNMKLKDIIPGYISSLIFMYKIYGSVSRINFNVIDYVYD
jgi:hypothetical protein